jgi:exopolysaccharide biosynthesis polyprenyl glycosylphosphotransferase
LKKPLYKYLLALIDFILINISFWLAICFHSNWQVKIVFSDYPFIDPQAVVILLYSIIVLFIFQYNDLYKINVFITITNHTIRLIQALFFSVLGFAVIAFFIRSDIIIDSQLVVSYYLLAALIIFIVGRVLLFRNLFRILAKNNLYTLPIIIIGSGKTAKLLAANLSLNNPYGLDVIGFVDDALSPQTVIFQSKKILGHIIDLSSIVEKYSIKEIIICTEDMTHERLLQMLDVCYMTKVRVKIASPLYGIITEKIFTETYGEVPVVDAGQLEDNLTRQLIKRLFDIVFTTVGMIILLPIFLIIAIAVTLDSRGPIIYSQIRIGKNGRPFRFYKFRSMVVDSDKDVKRMKAAARFIRGSINNNAKSNKIVSEDKVTRVGRFIRRTSIDELPQLFNVLKGDMSLVGPRPDVPYAVEVYEEWHKRRLSIKPGCTGVWQVNGRSEVTFEDMVILDLYYIQNCSFLLDLKILFKTIPVMILGKGGA